MKAKLVLPFLPFLIYSNTSNTREDGWMSVLYAECSNGHFSLHPNRNYTVVLARFIGQDCQVLLPAWSTSMHIFLRNNHDSEPCEYHVGVGVDISSMSTVNRPRFVHSTLPEPGKRMNKKSSLSPKRYIFTKVDSERKSACEGYVLLSR